MAREFVLNKALLPTAQDRKAQACSSAVLSISKVMYIFVVLCVDSLQAEERVSYVKTVF